MQVRFNPASSVKFDVGTGVVSGADGVRRLLIPADLLVELCVSAGPEAARDFGHRVGTEIGRRLQERLGDAVKRVGLEEVLEHLGGELAVAGFGSLGLERWGKALVMTVSHSVPPGLLEEKGGVTLLGCILEGALARLFSRDLRAVGLHRDGLEQRLLIVSPATAVRAGDLLKKGTPWADVIAQLHSGGS